jgi:hypothetical protein
VPRITALVAAAPRGGAGRVTVDLSRPAEVTFSFRGSPIARAWLGSGRTVVRLPAQPSARRGALTARPVAGAVAGDPISTTVSLPGGGRKGEAAVSTTRMRSGAQAVLYDMDAAVREVVDPQDGGLGLSAARGAMRQEPSTSGLFAPDDDSALVGKVTEEDLRGLDAGDIAAKLGHLVHHLGAPTLLVESGGRTAEGGAKLHAWWRLTEPAEAIDVARLIDATTL